MNPPGYATTPRQRGWVVGGDEPGSAGVWGSPVRSRRGGSTRRHRRSPQPRPGVNPPGYVTTPRQRGLGGRGDKPGSAGVVG
ncbi:MAG: hypothetical protein R3A10_20395 [Caldilineaceae bacterium]